MIDKLKGVKEIIVAQEFDAGGILERAKDAAMDKKIKEEASEIVIGSRKKKSTKAKSKRKRK